MRMRDLERRTGVGRETIRYYIGLGLLPEPVKPTRNTAEYTDDHVRRLEVIRRLQQERFLPLAFIKTVLDRRTAGEIESLPQLEVMLASNAGFASNAPSMGLDEAAGVPGLEPGDLAVLLADGVVRALEGGLAPLDVAILRAWGRIRSAGYSSALGFFPEDARLFLEAIEPMARREVDRFYERTSGALPPQEAAKLAQAGIDITNEMIGLIRTRVVLDRVSEINSTKLHTGPAVPKSDLMALPPGLQS